MDPWIAVIAAVVGGTGVAGLLTASVDLTRSARLKRSIEHLEVARHRTPPESEARKLAEIGIQAEAVRMASLALKSMRPPVMLYIASLLMVVAGTALTIYALIGDQIMLGAWASKIPGIVAGYSLVFLGVFVLAIWLRSVRESKDLRDRLVRMGLTDPESVKQTGG